MPWATTGDDWMGAPAAAKRLGIRLVTLYKLIDSGELPAYKIRRVVRLRRADVDAYIERTRVQPGTLGHLYPPGELEHQRRRRAGKASRPGAGSGSAPAPGTGPG